VTLIAKIVLQTQPNVLLVILDSIYTTGNAITLVHSKLMLIQILQRVLIATTFATLVQVLVIIVVFVTQTEVISAIYSIIPV
jgi:hypothetical protein